MSNWEKILQLKNLSTKNEIGFNIFIGALTLQKEVIEQVQLKKKLVLYFRKLHIDRTLKLVNKIQITMILTPQNFIFSNIHLLIR